MLVWLVYSLMALLRMLACSSVVGFPVVSLIVDQFVVVHLGLIVVLVAVRPAVVHLAVAQNLVVHLVLIVALVTVQSVVVHLVVVVAMVAFVAAVA